jgi:hypothetical protein
MDNEQGSSLKLLAAAVLAFGGVAMLAFGIATAGVPLQRPVCLSLAPSLCCSPAAQLMAGMPATVALPTLHTLTILQD